METLVRRFIDNPLISLASWVVSECYLRFGTIPQAVQFRTMLGCAGLQLVVGCFLVTRFEFVAVMIGLVFISATMVIIAVGHIGLRASTKPWSSDQYRRSKQDAESLKANQLFTRMSALFAFGISVYFLAVQASADDLTGIGLFTGMTSIALSEVTRSYLRAAEPPAFVSD